MHVWMGWSYRIGSRIAAPMLPSEKVPPICLTHSIPSIPFDACVHTSSPLPTTTHLDALNASVPSRERTSGGLSFHVFSDVAIHRLVV